ncbi:GNAT family N-acetyltransferase [Allohahella sp. A8]|uniref:GNAT family N-acetyltransferase n=1 Tax=Allohahella sp. A8 TaxID=3141461 RepID=UPI003A80C73F
MERKVYDSIDELGPELIARFEGSKLDFSYGILRAVEKGLWGDLRVHYLTIEAAGAAQAFMPVYVGTNININALLPQSVQDVYFKLVGLVGRSVKTRFAIAGCLISDKGWIPMLPEAASAELVEAMVSHIDCFSQQQNVQVSLIKDIHCAFPDDYLGRIEHHGYERLFSLPTVIIETDYKSFDDYTLSLTKNARKHSRKVLKAAHERFEFEIIEDYADYIEQIYPLFRGTFLKAKYQFDEAVPRFFLECARSREPQTELILCRKNGLIVGALINFFDDQEQLNKRIGIDYNQEDTPLIYTSLMYEGIRSAINKGLKRLYLGQSSYVPKLRLGGHIENEYFYVKAYDSLLKLTMPWQRRWSQNYEAKRVETLALEGVSI